jgi:hypothetical protein
VIKLKFGYTKARYRGIKKNANQVFTLCALSNLFPRVAKSKPATPLNASTKVPALSSGLVRRGSLGGTEEKGSSRGSYAYKFFIMNDWRRVRDSSPAFL